MWKPAVGLVVLMELSLVASSSATDELADFSQAESMLEFLERAAAGTLDSSLIDAVLATKGTSLIIEQQNRRARIDASQYRRVLETILDQEAPAIAPLDSTERAALGVRRLQSEVRVALQWGMEHIDILESELVRLKEMHIAREARAIAESYLPSPLSSTPSILFVAGGRAGFFAADDCTYMDLIIMSYSRTSRGEPFVSRQEVTAYFAHEMHHVGFRAQQDRLHASLNLDETSGRALGFVSSLVSEGSATYLISGDRDIEKIKAGRSYEKFFAMGTDLLKLCDEILRAILHGDLADDDDYAIATRPLLGMGVHSAGAQMMHVIDRGNGIEPIMRVIEDPRRLLPEYDRAVEKIQSAPGTDPPYRFDEEVTGYFVGEIGSDLDGK